MGLIRSLVSLRETVMKMNRQKVSCVLGISLVLVCGGGQGVSETFAGDSSSSTNQAEKLALAAKHCPTDLSSLQPKMKDAVQFIKSSTFRDTMLASLQASIPQAITQTDGLAQHIAWLKQEIAKQEQERSHAEKVAREGLEDPSQELMPCRHGKEGAYCYAVDQYLVSTAANLANHAFVDALECYQREGVQ